MIKEIFNLSNYFFNPWAVPVLITSLLVLFEGAGVYIKNPRALTNKAYGLWLIFVTIWLFFTGIWLLSKNPDVVLFWYKNFSFLGVSFISWGSFVFSLSFLEDAFNKKKKLMMISFLLFSIFYIINISSGFIVQGVYHYWWGYYPRYAVPGGGIFLFFWVLFYILTVFNLIKAHQKSSGLRKQQLAYILGGTIIVYSGAADFLPAYGMKIYPFGYIPVILYFALIAYTIIRYRAFDIDTVIHRTVLWLLTSVWLIMPAFIIFKILRPWLDKLNNYGLTLFALIFFYLFLWYYQVFQPMINRFFKRSRYDYHTCWERWLKRSL